MRRLAIVFSALISSSATAVPSFSLIWRDTGTQTITVSTSIPQLIIADVAFELETGDGTGGFEFHFGWDDDLKNELDFVGYEVLENVDLGTGGTWGSIFDDSGRTQQESTDSVAGIWGGFDFVSLGPDAFGPQTATIGSVRFLTNPSNVVTDGGDATLGFFGFNSAIDGYLFPGNTLCQVDCEIDFLQASVNPEPSTSVLLCAGLLLTISWSRERKRLPWLKRPVQRGRRRSPPNAPAARCREARRP